jgi:hypothetical protein
LAFFLVAMGVGCERAGGFFCWNLILPAGGDFSSVVAAFVFPAVGVWGAGASILVLERFTNFSSFI